MVTYSKCKVFKFKKKVMAVHMRELMQGPPGNQGAPLAEKTNTG